MRGKPLTHCVSHFLPLPTPRRSQAAILTTSFPPDGFYSMEEPGAGHQVALSDTDAGSHSAGMLRLYLTFLGSAQSARQTWSRPGNGFRPVRPRRGQLPRPRPVAGWASGFSLNPFALSTFASYPVLFSIFGFLGLFGSSPLGWVGQNTDVVTRAQKRGSPLHIL